MTAAYDRTEVERLIAEARAAHTATHSEEPPCTCADVLAARDRGVHEAGCPNKAHRHAHVDGWLWKEANLDAMADQLEAARAVVDRFQSLTLAEVDAENNRLRCLQFQEAATTLALSTSNRAKDEELATLRAMREAFDRAAAENNRGGDPTELARRVMADGVRPQPYSIVYALAKQVIRDHQHTLSLMVENEALRARVAKLEAEALERLASSPSC